MKLTRFRVILLLSLALTSGSLLVWHFTAAVPATSINSTCEPGACSSIDCSYYIYKDTTTSDANVNTTLAKNCTTGANDFKETTSDALLQDLFNTIAGVPCPGLPPPGGVGLGPQFTLAFGIGQFYITKSLTVNFPNCPQGGGSAASMVWRGQGEDKTTLILSNSVNANMTNIQNMGDKFEVDEMKFFGNKAQQSGTSTIFSFLSSDTGTEFIFTNDELRDCLTSCIYFNNGQQQWNQFTGDWFLNTPIGIDWASTHNDIRFNSNKCGSGSGTPVVCMQFDAGNTQYVSITGNVLNDATLNFVVGSTRQVAIVGNIFATMPTNAIFFQGTGLGSLTNFNSIIASNVFTTGTGTNVAVNLADFVDGVTVTANSFNGFTSSAAVPVTLTQTHQKLTTLVTQNSGMGSFWTGFGIAQPSVPSTGVAQQNTNPYQVRVYITGTGTGITAYTITDPSNSATTFTVTVNVGLAIDLDPYAKVTLTYTGSPTWKWYGLANLT